MGVKERAGGLMVGEVEGWTVYNIFFLPISFPFPFLSIYVFMTVKCLPILHLKKLDMSDM